MFRDWAFILFLKHCLIMVFADGCYPPKFSDKVCKTTPKKVCTQGPFNPNQHSNQLTCPGVKIYLPRNNGNSDSNPAWIAKDVPLVCESNGEWVASVTRPNSTPNVERRKSTANDPLYYSCAPN
ncbi:hypothetical protein PENTCL1PPCAC_29249 [Pristionchus entomophagus]|uniref:Secreted protein n=1 Tax=Pristionchus entomophagus TaxID=358040 RepID=A0AAV5ULI8_9BILA|nr:hypothetical protein PENTCL1PPCAC_29249 [Pristionchus entomophagus]